MAKVYNGRVMIPGDKIEQYLKIMAEAEKKREPFRQYLFSLNGDFREHLESKLSSRTARQHSSIVGLFVDFICRQTDVEKIEDITRGMVNTHFKNWWRRKVWDSTTPDQLRVALRKFFAFLAENKGIVNEKVFESFAVNTKKDNKGETWIQGERPCGGWQRWQLRIEGTSSGLQWHFEARK